MTETLSNIGAEGEYDLDADIAETQARLALARQQAEITRGQADASTSGRFDIARAEAAAAVHQNYLDFLLSVVELRDAMS